MSRLLWKYDFSFVQISNLDEEALTYVNLLKQLELRAILYVPKACLGGVALSTKGCTRF